MTQSSGPAAKRLRFTSELVTIKVGRGPDSVTFNVHEDTIKERSEFFGAAFDRKWKEGRCRELHLPEDDPHVVEAYMQWLYEGKVADIQQDQATFEQVSAHYSQAACLYVFGEKIQDTKFCNAVMEDMARTSCIKVDVEKWTYCPHDARMVNTIYDGTPAGSPARRFLVDCVQQSAGHAEDAGWFTEEATKYRPEFLLDSARALMARQCPDHQGTRYEQRAKWMKEE